MTSTTLQAAVNALPQELQDQIEGLVFTVGTTKKYLGHYRPTILVNEHWIPPAQLQVNSALRKKLQVAFYGSAEWTFLFSSADVLLKWLKSLFTARYTLISTVDILCDLRCVDSRRTSKYDQPFAFTKRGSEVRQWLRSHRSGMARAPPRLEFAKYEEDLYVRTYGSGEGPESDYDSDGASYGCVDPENW